MRVLKPGSYIPSIKGITANTVKHEHIFPFYASFKITSNCHFGCPYCNVKKSPAPDVDTRGIKAVLDNLSRSSVLMTSFEGGEPLLREDIGELLEYASRCSFYLLFTTSARSLEDYPLNEYAKYIDFFHISIDEGHGNLEMFEKLSDLTELKTQVSVQTVVTKDTVDRIEEKVKKCYDSGANIVIIPASPMEEAEDHFPDMDEMEKKVKGLIRKYPLTIHTPEGYFDAYREGKCSPASIIIDSDCRLYYPCHILNHKGPDLSKIDLNTWLESKEASKLRNVMRNCKRNCGWYQYYAINSYLNTNSAFSSIKPMLLQKTKQVFRRS